MQLCIVQLFITQLTHRYIYIYISTTETHKRPSTIRPFSYPHIELSVDLVIHGPRSIYYVVQVEGFTVTGCAGRGRRQQNFFRNLQT
jgi:hypothetical protein